MALWAVMWTLAVAHPAVVLAPECFEAPLSCMP